MKKRKFDSGFRDEKTLHTVRPREYSRESTQGAALQENDTDLLKIANHTILTSSGLSVEKWICGGERTAGHDKYDGRDRFHQHIACCQRFVAVLTRGDIRISSPSLRM